MFFFMKECFMIYSKKSKLALTNLLKFHSFYSFI